MDSTGSLLISQSKTHYRCYRVFIESLHGVYMEFTGSLLISQSKTHYRCYRVVIESLHGVCIVNVQIGNKEKCRSHRESPQGLWGIH